MIYRFALLLCAAGTAFAQTDVAGIGNFSHIVSNLDKSIEFYRDVIGLELSAQPQPFSPNPAIMKLGNTPGAQSHVAVMKIPGANFGVELIDYKDIDRKPAHPRFQDPGAGNLAVLVKDVQQVADRLKKSGAHILTLAGAPVEVQNVEKGFFAQDPDGFIVEVTQMNQLPAAAANATGNVYGAGIEISVDEIEKTAKFLRDGLGFNVRVNDAFNDNKLMADTAGTPGAKFRQGSTNIPGANVRLSLIEFRNIERKALDTRVQDPGTSIIQLRVHDLDGIVAKVKAAGGTVVSTGGVPVEIGNRKIVIVRGTDNLFLELLPAQ